VAPLPTLIAMKLNAAISGEDTLKLGADTGGRSREEIQKDIADIRELIIIRGLGRSLQLGQGTAGAFVPRSRSAASAALHR
jgi:hypothetical protein